MPLTRDFRSTVKARAERDPAFKAALYGEAVRAVIEGDLPTAKVLLRDFINATVGFSRLAAEMNVTDKSLMRMFSPTGNPRADNLLSALARLRADAGLVLTVTANPARRRPPQHRGPPRRRAAEPVLA
jgi:DNA-binding phage protein